MGGKNGKRKIPGVDKKGGEGGGVMGKRGRVIWRIVPEDNIGLAAKDP